MKNNIIYKICLFAALALTTTSCSDDDKDPSPERLFRPVGISSTVSQNSVEVSWEAISGTASYNVELSLDQTFASIALTKSTTAANITFDGLLWATKYYLRIKGISADGAIIGDSRYSDGGSFMTQLEPAVLLQPEATDITKHSVKLSWTDRIQVSKIALTIDDKNPTDYPITGVDVTNRYMTINNLTPNTTYKATIYESGSGREVNYVTFKTGMDIPDGAILVNAGDNLKTAIANAPDGAVVAIMPGTFFIGDDLEPTTISDLALDKNITIMGATTVKPIIELKTMALKLAGTDVSANLALIKFMNIEIDGTKGDGGYVIDQRVDVNVERFEFDNCYIHDFANSLYRSQSTTTATIRNLIVNNTIIKNVVGKNDFIRPTIALECHVEITNSTIINVTGSNFINLGGNASTQTVVTMQNNTIFGIDKSSKYFLDPGSASAGNPKFIIKDNIIINTGSGMKSARKDTQLEAVSNIIVQDWAAGGTWNGNDIPGTLIQVFGDRDIATSLDFRLDLNSPAIGQSSTGGNIGDPRWWPNI